MQTETDRWLAEGQALVGHKDYALALIPLNRILRQHPTGATASMAWRLKGEALAGLGHLEQAYSAYDQAVLAQPDSLAALTQRGRLGIYVHRYTESIADLQRVLQHTPDNAEVWSDLGDAYRRAHQSPETMAAYERALTLNPKVASAWYGKAKELERLGQADAALTAYQRAAAVAATDAEIRAMALVGAGLVLTASERWDEAYVLAEQAQQATGASPAERARAFSLGGYIRIQQKRYADAVTQYEASLALDPTSAEVWHGKGWALDRLEHVDEAVATYDEALRLDPTNHVFQRHRKYARAHALLQQSPPLDPEDPAFAEINDPKLWREELLYFIGRKRYREAEAAGDQLLRLFPRSGLFLLLKAFLQANQKRRRDAWHTVQQLWKRPSQARAT